MRFTLQAVPAETWNSHLCSLSGFRIFKSLCSVTGQNCKETGGGNAYWPQRKLSSVFSIFQNTERLLTQGITDCKSSARKVPGASVS